MAEPENPTNVTALTVQLLSAYLINNTVASEHLAELIRTTRAALTQDTAEVVSVEEPEVHTPAVSVRKSLSSPEYLVSLIDGKRYKTLKRHLTSHGLTPEAYRERYGLSASYPMVAPEFAAKRREIAGRIGLGRRPQADAVPVPAQTAAKSPDHAVNATDTAAVAAPAAPAKPTKGAKPAATKAVPARKKPATAPKSTTTPKTPAVEVPVAAPAEAVTPDALTGEKKVAKPRKTKTTADMAVSADAVTSATPASSETSSAKAVDVTPKKVPTKRKSRSAAKSGEAKAAPAVSAEAPTPTTDVASEAPAKAAPKRRGKLGLFGKGQGAEEVASPEATAGAGVTDAASEPAKRIKPAKVAKPKRMARTPKSAEPDAG